MSEPNGVIRIRFQESTDGRFLHCYVCEWFEERDGTLAENIIGLSAALLRGDSAAAHAEARSVALWAAVTDCRLERKRWKARMREEALSGAPWNQ